MAEKAARSPILAHIHIVCSAIAHWFNQSKLSLPPLLFVTDLLSRAFLFIRTLKKVPLCSSTAKIKYIIIKLKHSIWKQLFGIYFVYHRQRGHNAIVRKENFISLNPCNPCLRVMHFAINPYTLDFLIIPSALGTSHEPVTLIPWLRPARQMRCDADSSSDFFSISISAQQHRKPKQANWRTGKFVLTFRLNRSWLKNH